MQSYDEEGLRDRPIGELFKRLSQDLALLVRQELDLARVELVEKSKTVGAGAGMLSGAAIAGLLALGSLTACLILALSMAMAPWLAALLVTIAYGAAAGVLALRGKKKIEEATPLVPQQTLDTVKEDVKWAKTQIKSGAR